MNLRLLLLGFLVIFISGCQTTSSPDSDNRFNVSALSNWTKQSGIRIANKVSTSTIRLKDGRYRSYYPVAGGIGSSISSDGLTFTAEAGVRLAEGTGSDYDVNGAKDPDLVIESCFWRVYYTGIGPDNKHRVMSAYSWDGYTFTKEAGVRVDCSADYDQLADVPSVVKINNSTYFMYFVYDWYGDNSLKGAVSGDGLSWEVVSLTGFSDNCMDPEVVTGEAGELIMFFAAPRTTSAPEPVDIYKATSSDGSSWTVLGRALAPEKSEEGDVLGDPDIIQLPDGTYRMYYYGGDPQVHSDILSATAESL